MSVLRRLRSDVTLTGSGRATLLTMLQDFAPRRDLSITVREAFEDAGASRPVSLESMQIAHLCRMLNLWVNETTNPMPPGLVELREALNVEMSAE